MFVGHKIVYLDLQKTGSTHIKKLLSNLPLIEGKKYRKHITFDQLPIEAQKNWDAKIKLGSIRSPWAWYVSLWAYGCGNKGAIYKTLTQFLWNDFNQKDRSLHYLLIPRKKWASLYQDVHSKKAFKDWLRLLFSSNRKRDLIEYGKSPISKYSGLYTYRYFRLYQKDFLEQQALIDSSETMRNLDQSQNMVDTFIHQENLNQDFLSFLQKNKIETSPKMMKMMEEKTNSSQHLRFEEYYDEESFEWVKNQEWFIIDKHGYNQYNYDNGIRF